MLKFWQTADFVKCQVEVSDLTRWEQDSFYIHTFHIGLVVQ